MAVTIEKTLFGKTKEGEDVYRYTFNGSRVEVSILDYGGALQAVRLPDRTGSVADISLGYDDVAGYEQNPQYMGVLVGRVAGRIARGAFTLDGRKYELVINNGPNNIHGGLRGFSRRLWKSRADGDILTLTYHSPDGEEGFPGAADVTVTYRLSVEGALTIDYTLTTTAPCPFNLTNHAYFNLAGHDADSVFDHSVQIHADTYVPVDENLIPTGDTPSVEGKAVDLRQPTLLQEREAAIRAGDLDITYCVGDGGSLKRVARVHHPTSGRYVEASTTEPGLQFYTAKYMENSTGKSGKEYRKFASFCLETQHYPDSVNHDNFPNTILRPGETYRQTTVFTFGSE